MLRDKLKHRVRLATDAGYRDELRQRVHVATELERLKVAPRFTRVTTDILGPPFVVVDGPTFFMSWREIIDSEIYAFRSDAAAPVVLDCGAHVGLGVVYVKRRFPAARVTAFEADPAICGVLAENVKSLGLDDVTVVNSAVWSADTRISFAAEGADGGRIARACDTIPRRVEVDAVRLRPYLAGAVDFLKIDIEGAETDVLLDCEDLLVNVRNLFVEYHSFAAEPQRLDELLRVLRRAGFRVQIQVPHPAPRPLLDRPANLGMDFQCNVFAVRETSRQGG